MADGAAPAPVDGGLAIVADLHLRGPSDPHQQAFLRFLSTLPSSFRVVVAGDLFQFAYGVRGMAPPARRPVLDALRLRGDSVLVEGNHEFRLGDEAPGLDVRQGWQRFDTGAGVAVVGHGDGLGPGGWATTALGWVLRRPATARLVHLLGPERATRLGERLADRGGRGRPYRNEEPRWLAAARAAAAEARRSDGARWVVLGHSHRRGSWDDTLWCPGDWRVDRLWFAAGPQPGLRRFEAEP